MPKQTFGEPIPRTWGCAICDQPLEQGDDYTDIGEGGPARYAHAVCAYVRSNTKLRLSFRDTLNVLDADERWVGQIALMSGGWAAYRVANEHHVVQERIGTYEDAEQAIRALIEHGS